LFSKGCSQSQRLLHVIEFIIAGQMETLISSSCEVDCEVVESLLNGASNHRTGEGGSGVDVDCAGAIYGAGGKDKDMPEDLLIDARRSFGAFDQAAGARRYGGFLITP
jgi:hypothetical protein